MKEKLSALAVLAAVPASASTVGGPANGPLMLVNGQFMAGQASTGYEVGIRRRF